MNTLIAASIGLLAGSWYHYQENSPALAFCLFGKKPETPFSPMKYKEFELVEVVNESHNVKRFRFALPDKEAPLNLPLASCINIRYIDKDGNEVSRPYTPINHVDDKGHFDLVIKKYPNSKMGTHLFNLSVSDHIEAKGPYQTFPVKLNQYKQIGMLAGGTGITPMYQIISNFVPDKENKTKISLLYANVSEDDILMNKELTEFSNEHPSTFSVHHCLNNPPSRWNGFTGYITKEMIASTLPPASGGKDNHILVSGPPGFMEVICGQKDYSCFRPKQGLLKGYLKDLGFSEDCVHKFETNLPYLSV